MQPGQTINPGSQTPEPEQPQQAQQSVAPQPPAEAEIPAPPLTPTTPAQPQQIPTPAPPSALPEQQNAGWQFNEEDNTYDDQFSAPQQTPAVSWTASEYVAHDKNTGWYLSVVGASVVVAAVVYLITRDYISPVVVVVLGIAFAAFGARKPQVLDYQIDNSGVHIGPKHYPYELYRTFSVLEEDAVRSILLMPIQRFNLPISLYYDPADETRIVEVLGAHLPHEDRKPAVVDNFMRKIRF